MSVYQPFITAWVGGDKILPLLTVTLFISNFFVWKKSDIATIFRDACGLWDKIKLIPYLGSIINIVLNLILVNFWGLNGVVFSTIVCFVFMLPFEINNVYKNFFEEKQGKYYLNFVIQLLLAGACCAANYFACFKIDVGNVYLNLLIVIAISVFAPLVILVPAAFIIYREETSYCLSVATRAFRRRFKSS